MLRRRGIKSSISRQVSKLEKLVFAWVQYDDDAFMFCNLNAIHNCEQIWEEEEKKRLENALGQTSKRLLCWTLNIYLSLCMQRRWRFFTFYSASIMLNLTNGHCTMPTISAYSVSLALSRIIPKRRQPIIQE